MEYNWNYDITQDSATGLDSDQMYPGERKQDRFLGLPMNRTKSGSSMESRRSTGSYLDQTVALSPITSYADSPLSDGGSNLPPFDIEKNGDPRIAWYMYYDFVVTKTDAYYELQPSYIATEKYRQQVKSEKVIFKGKICSPCRVPDCKSDPFTRHYDLERHFRTCHVKNDKEQMKCDYPKCIHTEPFRKDHCREHYREYHKEDLPKKGRPKPEKCEKSKKNSKPSSEKPETVEQFLASRRHVNFSWWRCSRCVQRVDVSKDNYACPRCNVSCEQERIDWRKKKAPSANNSEARSAVSGFSSSQARSTASSSSSSQVGNSMPGYSPAPMDYITDCGQCQNAWVLDENDVTLWHSCLTCQQGVTKTTRF